MKDNCVAPIWNKIKEDVEQELWSEFHKAYHNDTSNTKFRGMIENGGYCETPSLKDIYLKLEYKLEQKSLQEQKFFLRVYNHRFWENRHATPKDQEAFDKQWGLVIIKN